MIDIELPITQTFFLTIDTHIGTLTGGYIATRISRQGSQLYVRNFVILAGTSITLYFFYDTYAL